MSLTVVSRIGKKFALYLPRSVVDLLGVKEGDKVVISVEGRKVVVRVVKDPIELALHGEKFASLSQEDVEKMSLEWQAKYEGAP